MVLFRLLMVAGMILCCIGTSFAVAAGGYYRWAVEDMLERIDRGVMTGELTCREASHLRQEVWDVENDRRKMLRKNHGRPLSRDQKRNLERDMNRVSRLIFREKHDSSYYCEDERLIPPGGDVSAAVNAPERRGPSGSVRVAARWQW